MEHNEEKLRALIKIHVPEAERLEIDMKKSQYLGRRKLKKSVPKQKSKKVKFISRKVKKSTGLFHLPGRAMKYEEAMPLHRLWKIYMKNQLGLDENRIPTMHDKSWENIAGIIFKSDFDGALVSVLSSKCPSLIGITGICLLDTKNTFKIITPDNEIKTVPKDKCEFSFDLGYKCKFNIFGKHICKRPAERSLKHSKQFLLSEL